MTYFSLVRELAKATGLTHDQVRELLTLFAAAIHASALLGESTAIPRLGVFRPSRRRARRIRDVHSGELMELPEQVSVRFRPARHMRRSER